MTIKAIAERLGVSVPTLYRRLKAEGIDIRGLRDDKTGKVTAEGAAIIADLIGGDKDDAALREVLDGASHSVSPDVTSNISALEVRAAVAETRAAAAEETIRRLDAECARLRDEVATLTGLLRSEQEQRQLMLTEANHNQRRRGLFSWFKRGDRGDT